MTELSPKSKAILGLARPAYEPSADDRGRVRGRLATRLAIGAAAGGAAAVVKPAAAAVASGVTAKVVVAAVVLVGAVGAGVAGFAVGSKKGFERGTESARFERSAIGVDRPVAPTPVAAPPGPSDPAEPVVLPTPPVPAEVKHMAPLSVPPASSSPAISVPRPPLDEVAPSIDAPGIAEEVRSMREVQLALRAGNAKDALDRLDAVARRFPRGALQEERDAAEVLALCKLGRIDEGRLRAARFAAAYPESPQAPPVRVACGGGASSP